VKVIIANTMDGTCIYIYEEHYMGMGSIAVAQPVELVFRAITNEGIDPQPPFLKMSPHFAMEFLPALREALDDTDKKREKEIKLQTENKMLREQIEHLKGLLQAIYTDKGRHITL
jgi:hypothetical protein